MTLVMVLLTIAVVAGVAALAAGVLPGGLDAPASSIPVRSLPDRPLTGQDVADLRFVMAFRGYRMDQVDAAMDGLAAEIDRLRGLLGEAGPAEGGTEAAGLEAARFEEPRFEAARPSEPEPDRAELGQTELLESHSRSDSESEAWPAGWNARG